MSAITYSLDPGANTGVARWEQTEDGWQLVEARTLPLDDARRLVAGHAVVLEEPEYQGGRTRSVQSLLELARRAEQLVGLAASVRRMRVSEWKGSTPKKITRARAVALLSAEEVAAVVDGRHDTWDAVALGLVALGRARRGVL